MTGDLDRWAEHLDDVAARAPAEATKVVAKGALNIKNDARRRAKAIGAHVRRYPYTIGYDLDEQPDGASAEVGPDPEKGQGALGHLLERGSPTSPPHPHMLPAGVAEEPRFEKAMEDLAVRLLEGR